MTPPKHPFEVEVRIGGNDWPYVLRTMKELAEHLSAHGPECNLVSGGYGGCHSVEVRIREISPDQYRDELRAWMDSRDSKGEEE